MSSSRRAWFTSDEDLVFCNEIGRYFEDSALRRRFYAARQRAAIKTIRFHDLRHTFGTLAVQVFHPDFYNGAFVACPDPIDFRAFTNIDLYHQPNAFYLEGEHKQVEQPAIA